MVALGAAMPNNIDPLEYEERLTQAGVPAEQALDPGLASLLATVDKMKFALEAKINESKWAIIRWTAGVSIVAWTVQGFIIVNVLR